MNETGRGVPKSVWLASGVVVVVSGAILLLHRDAARELWGDLTAVPAGALAAALLFVLCQWTCQVLRLWALVPPGIPLSLGRIFYAYGIGSWINIVAPARAGDAFKVVLMNRGAERGAVSLPQATGILLADKIVDIGSLLLLCAATGLLGLFGARLHLKPLGRWLLIGGAAGLVLVGIAAFATPRHWIAYLDRWRQELTRGLSALADPLRLFGSTSFCLGAWTAELLAIRVLCGALGYQRSLASLVLSLALLNVGTSVPISMANIGIYEAALAFGLHQTGIPVATAVVIATLHHALQLLVTTAGAAAARFGAGGGRLVPAKQPLDG